MMIVQDQENRLHAQVSAPSPSGLTWLGGRRRERKLVDALAPKSLASALSALILCFVAPARAADVYVSPSGNDAWSGRLASADAGQTDGPLATFERARQVVRDLKAAKPNEPVDVVICGGLYLLSEAFVLSSDDSGTAAGPVTYRAYPGERPVLAGARELTGWRRGNGPIWTVDLRGQGISASRVRQVFFRGERQTEARYPNADSERPVTGGWAYAGREPVPASILDEAGEKRALRLSPEDIRDWAHPEQGSVFIFPSHEWWNNIVPVDSYLPETGVLVLTRDCSYAIKAGDRFYVSGMLEELDAPGEWCADASTQTCHFWPPAPLGSGPVYVPVTDTIWSMEGARHVTVRGLQFQYCDGNAVRLRDCDSCMVAGCRIRQVGHYGGSGVSVSGGSNCGVVGCDIAFTGRSGITLSGGNQETLTPAGNYAENNWITRTGVFYKQGAGISIRGVGNRASRNTIHHVPRWAIGFGGNQNVIELNELHHVCLETTDTGAIYGGSLSWLSAHGTVIRHNYIHDVIGCGRREGEWRRPFYAWGIYLDWTAMGVTVYGNVVVGAPRAGIMVHDGRFNRIENNVIVDCGGGEYDVGSQIEASGWHTAHHFWTLGLSRGWVSQYESVADQPAWLGPGGTLRDPRESALPDGRTMHSNRFQRNILCYRGESVQAFRFRNVSLAHNPSDRNVIWPHGGAVRTGMLSVREVVGDNLLPSSGFEELGSAGMPAGWSARLPIEESRVEAVSGTAHSGQRSVRLRGVYSEELDCKPTWARQVMLRSTPITSAAAGGYYRLSCWLRAAAADTAARVEALCFKAGVHDVRFGRGLLVGTEWTPCEILLQVPDRDDARYRPGMEETLYVRVRLAQDEGTLWVDDVVLREFIPMSEWAAWLDHGMDRRSVVADPLFVNAAAGDYRLQEASPAWPLGFKPIPTGRIGCYPDPLRASWPMSP